MNDMEAYGDGYMEPEEEWEREGLLDPAWEKQQKKVSADLATAKGTVVLTRVCLHRREKRSSVSSLM